MFIDWCISENEIISRNPNAPHHENKVYLVWTVKGSGNQEHFHCHHSIEEAKNSSKHLISLTLEGEMLNCFFSIIIEN